MGGECLASAPAFRTCPCGSGYVVTLSANPGDWDSSEYKTREESVRRHLREEYFSSAPVKSEKQSHHSICRSSPPPKSRSRPKWILRAASKRYESKNIDRDRLISAASVWHPTEMVAAAPSRQIERTCRSLFGSTNKRMTNCGFKVLVGSGTRDCNPKVKVADLSDIEQHKRVSRYLPAYRTEGQKEDEHGAASPFLLLKSVSDDVDWLHNDNRVHGKRYRRINGRH
jgi:hypothetical protein